MVALPLDLVPAPGAPDCPGQNEAPLLPQTGFNTDHADATPSLPMSCSEEDHSYPRSSSSSPAGNNHSSLSQSETTDQGSLSEDSMSLEASESPRPVGLSQSPPSQQAAKEPWHPLPQASKGRDGSHVLSHVSEAASLTPGLECAWSTPSFSLTPEVGCLRSASPLQDGALGCASQHVQASGSIHLKQKEQKREGNSSEWIGRQLSHMEDRLRAMQQLQGRVQWDLVQAVRLVHSELATVNWHLSRLVQLYEHQAAATQALQGQGATVPEGRPPWKAAKQLQSPPSSQGPFQSTPAGRGGV
ncbi:uncharacterized protein LOC120391270 [Mauremys reevesii]|uniref:uncharacterized protein LOC120391270 n=1 Tax=Mauremys reevesii TaxID=260615 RepID=UPI00193EE9ED|nr:uncharacterized protein LOC120391270 [Mauremys reevesii]XP_039370693.1 uncharacterized protein LOC120391270 [Mauremys reevesii]